MEDYQPHNYQLRAMQLLVGRADAGLVLDPGLGKTSSVLGAYASILDVSPGTKMLVIAPIAPMLNTWPGEVKKWRQFSHLKVAILHGRGKERALQEDADIYVINPEGIRWLFECTDKKARPKWDILCVDESTKFKSSSSRRFKILKSQLHEFSRRWILTGTIVPNGLMDLFAQVYIMDLGDSLGKFITHYRNAYFMRTGYGGYTWAPQSGAMEIISERIKDKVLCLKAEDYLDMPDIRYVERLVTLPRTAQKQYDEIEKEFLLELGDDTILAPNAAAMGVKCRQIANGSIYNEEGHALPLHTVKADELLSLTEEIGWQPTLILYEFKFDRDRIIETLGDHAVVITGLKGLKHTNTINAFNSGNIRYLVAHSGSMHGLNIQSNCHHMIWYGLTWNLENYLQSVYRLYRQGQKNAHVLCYHILAKGTLDQKVARVLVQKDADQQSLIDRLKE